MDFTAFLLEAPECITWERRSRPGFPKVPRLHCSSASGITLLYYAAWRKRDHFVNVR